MKRFARTTVVLAAPPCSLRGIVRPVPRQRRAIWEHYHGEDGPEVSFCGDLVQRGETDGRFRTVVHGPDGLPY